MIKIIAGVSQNGIIGIFENGIGKIPWHYSADMKHFKEKTLNSTIIMGRATFESMNSKPLPKRRNIIISSQLIDGIETSSSLSETMENLKEENIWLIGGARIYQEGMNYAKEIHLTLMPETINHPSVVRFPWINPSQFKLSYLGNLTPENDQLKYAVYQRI